MNKSVKCIIVDDEPLAGNIIRDYIEQIPQLELVSICNSALEAFQEIHQNQIDLMFLDIEMPEMTGLDFLKSISHPPDVILTTAYRKYAIESYEVDVTDYLLKPISFQRFFKSITKYLEKKVSTQKDLPATVTIEHKGSMFVYSEKKNVKVYFKDILYIESIKDYIRIHTSDKNIISKDTISRYDGLLPHSFLRIHRSFIVNKEKITAFTNHDVEIGSKELPIGISYKKEVLVRLAE